MNFFHKLKSFFCPSEQSSMVEEKHSFVPSQTQIHSQIVQKPIRKRLKLLQDLEQYSQTPAQISDRLQTLTYIEPKGTKQTQLQEIVINEVQVIETPKWVTENQFNFNKKSVPEKENIPCDIIKPEQQINNRQVNQIQAIEYSFQNNKSIKSSSKNSQWVNSSVKDNYMPKKVFKFEFEELKFNENQKSSQFNVLHPIEDINEQSNTSEMSIQPKPNEND